MILALGGVSAHFNPAVTILHAVSGAMPGRRLGAYVVMQVLMQVLGAFAGVAVAHLMFGLDLFTPSVRSRAGMGQVFSEAIATRLSQPPVRPFPEIAVSLGEGDGSPPKRRRP